MSKIPKSQDIEKSIVQIFTDHAQPSYAQPWTIMYRNKSSGTGFCININDYKTDKYKLNSNKNKFIITNAHCVHNSTYITIRKRGIAFTYKGKIEDIVYECDLAILSIDTEFYLKSKQKKDLSKIMTEFWDDLFPLEIGGLPSKLDSVYVYGYPLGGFNISITTGSVNRIQVIEYFDVVYGIAIQIDAPINFGNSGGPVVNINGNVVGVAFSGEDDKFTQNMGYIIPTTLVRHFLTNVINNYKNNIMFQGLCSLSIVYQRLNNVVLREYLKLSRTETGVLVTDVEKFGASENILKKMDVITHINNKKIDNDGTMLLQDIILDNDPFIIPGNEKSELLQEGEVAPFTNYISLKKTNDEITLTVLRNGKKVNVNIKLKPKLFLAPRLDYQIKPSYFIVGGLVFLPLSLMLFLEKKDNKEYVSHLREYIEQNKQIIKVKNEQIIILSEIFVTELTEDFNFDNYVLKSVNNINIINLEHLYQTVVKERKKSNYLTFEFKDTSEIIILSCSDIAKHENNILLENLGDVPKYSPS